MKTRVTKLELLGVRYTRALSHHCRPYETLDGYIAKAAVLKTTAERREILKRVGIPAIRCNMMEEVLKDPRMTITKFFQDVEYPDGEIYRSMRHPVQYSEAPAEIYRHPPKLGGGNAEVRAALGVGTDTGECA